MSIKIYIDQGHNPSGFNTGAEGNGYYEQDITYEIGRRLNLLLSDDPEFETRLSRPTPDTILGTNNSTSLSARVNEANSTTMPQLTSALRETNAWSIVPNPPLPKHLARTFSVN